MISQIIQLLNPYPYSSISFWYAWADLVSLAVVIGLSLYVFIHSYYRAIPAVLYKVLVVSPVALILPSVIFTLGSYTTKLAMLESLVVLFVIGLVGLVISIVAAVAYGINTRSFVPTNICTVCGTSYQGDICPVCAGEYQPSTIPHELPDKKTKLFVSAPTTGYLIGMSSSSVYKLSGDTVLGRGSDTLSDLPKIQIDGDDYVSRIHARVRFDGKRHQIADSSSTSGTFVNGSRIAGWTTLEEGDIVRIGKTQLKYTKNK